MRRLAAIILLLAGCQSVPELESVDPAAEIWSYCSGDGDNVVSVAVVRDGIPAFAGDPRAIYRIGSFTEFFVAEAAERIADRGEIDLDRPLTAFARFRLDPFYARVTMRELLEMRSGLPRGFFFGCETREDFIDRINSRGAVRSVLGRQERLATGETFHGEQVRSDVGFRLFTILLEEAVGKSVEEIVRDEIVLPLQLRDTSFTPSADKLPRLVDDGGDGLYSTIEDCVKFFASSDRVRNSCLLSRAEKDGVAIDFAVEADRGDDLLAYPRRERDLLLLFRTGSVRSESDDFLIARRAFRR